MNYQSLATAADGIVHSILQRCGNGEDPVVLLCGEHSIDSIASTLAVLRAGRIYIPLESCDPFERLRYQALVSSYPCAQVVEMLTVAGLAELLEERPTEEEVRPTATLWWPRRHAPHNINASSGRVQRTWH